MKSALFYLGLGTLLTHELDAMLNHEWRVLPVFRSLPEDLAATTFVALHVPILAAVIALVASKNEQVRRLTRIAVAVFLLFHCMAHFLSSDDPNYEFSSILSLYLIFGGAVFGAGFLALEYNGAQTTASRLVSMKESLGIGFETEQSHTVTAEMSPPHLPMKVLSTPSMVQLIEATCLTGIAPHLDDSETSVGTHVNFSHVGPAHAGEEVVVKVRLSAINKRRLTFDVEVHSPRGVISTGTHERAVIDPSRLG